MNIVFNDTNKTRVDLDALITAVKTACWGWLD